jgi:anti-sigma-K factor RskA
VAHLNAELLAGHALGQTDELDAGQLKHVASCPECRAEVDQLRRIVELGRDRPDPVDEPIPVQRMWRNIADGLSLDTATAKPPAAMEERHVEPMPRTGAAMEETHAEPMPRTGAEAPKRQGLRRWAVMLAAAVGLLAGAGGTVLVNVLREPDVQVVASATLNPLPGQAGDGTAQLISEDGTTELRVSVTGAAPARDYREVWLINTDGKRMYSLGVLPRNGSGTYVVPAGLGEQLDGFTIVDVSIEPYDGNAAHSLRSQVRGTLPL